MNWDDLRAFLAVVENGGLAAAGRATGVNHATVQRRIGRLEAALGVRLFDRSPAGYILTAAGEELAAGSGDFTERILALEARIAGRDLQLTGTVRLTTVDSIAETVLPGYLRSFHRSCPEVTVEVVVENRVFNLTRREADIALRPGPEPPGTMVGRRFGAMGFGIYAAPGCEDAVIGADESLQHLKGVRWFTGRMEARPTSVRCNNFLSMLSAARAGLGTALLPCLLADGCSDLVRSERLPDETAVDLWLLSHPDIRRVARVRAVLDHLSVRLARDREQISGLAGMNK